MSDRPGISARLGASVGRLELELELQVGAETLVIIGPNGAGKSTTLSLLLGAVRPVRGSVRVGADLLFDSESAVDVPIESRRLGYVPQNYALFPHLSVRDNVAFGPRSRRTPDVEARVDGVIERFGLGALAGRHVKTLSGGEQQRVALARALAVEPRALLLDEPLGALDPFARDEVRETLGRTLLELGLPTLLVTHDAMDARRLGARIAVLEGGKISQLGSYDELAATPASRFVEQFTSR